MHMMSTDSTCILSSRIFAHDGDADIDDPFELPKGHTLSDTVTGRLFTKRLTVLWNLVSVINKTCTYIV